VLLLYTDFAFQDCLPINLIETFSAPGQAWLPTRYAVVLEHDLPAMSFDRVNMVLVFCRVMACSQAH
jgi:hypothetical protein